MPRIIISYRREDSGVITGRIFDRLVAQYGREAIFRDIDDVPFGVDFREHISRVINESDIVLAIIGPRWLGPRGAQNRLNNEADPVRVEIEIALRNSVPLIPLLVLRAAMPQASQLPESLRDFAYRNALQVDAEQDFDVHMTRLLRAMDGILGRSAAVAPTAAAPEPPKRRRMLAGGLIAAVLGIVAAAGWYVVSDRQKSPAPADTAAPAPNVTPSPAPSPPNPPSQSATAPVAVPAPGIDPELLFWQSIANNGTQADFEEYLRRYPQGQFAGLAHNRLTALQAPPPPAPLVAPPAEPAPPASVQSAPSALAEGEARWTIEEKREVQRALRTLGHYQGEPDGGFGTGTRAAIKEFREFGGSAGTGEMTEAERKTLIEMAQRLAILLDQPANSPQGVASASIKGGAQRYARAYNFESGKGVKADPAEAAYWYALAAADGEAKAFTNLGTLIARGWGATKPDPAAAGLLWWAAAARGEAIAMFDEGVLYERGIGVTADAARARAWYQRAAERNHPGAKDALKRLGL
jgi:TPR repeat protein